LLSHNRIRLARICTHKRINCTPRDVFLIA
jgi:hypothetical protein